MTDESFLGELRLFLEGVCCDALRFDHVARDGLAPEDVHIRQEVALRPDAFADLVVAPRGRPAYYVEVDYGYSRDRLLESLTRKYGPAAPDPVGGERVVLVIDTETRAGWPALEIEAKAALRPGLALEVMGERELRELVSRRFELHMPSLGEAALLDLRAAVDAAKGRHAFGEGFDADPLQDTLLWHFAFWRLRQLRSGGLVPPRDILPPGPYRGVIVVMADISGFTRLVRDTHDDAVVRRSLTAFASKTRYQIVNDGGMLYQFLGDAVIALFGVPERAEDDVTRALGCATALLDIGAAVVREWQRQIDHVQGRPGVHVAMTQGDLQVISFRPFSRTHVGAVGDAINLAARLNDLSGAGEIVMSNSLYQRMPPRHRAEFTEMDTVEAKNLGQVRAWKRAG